MRKRLVSNSEVQTFKQCRRRWYLGWYLGLRPRVKSVLGVRNTGTRLHIALEARYQPGVPAPASTVVQALQEAQAADMETASQDPFWGVEQHKELVKSFTLEQIMITGYLEWLEETGEDSDLEVTGSEVYLQAHLEELEGVDIIGKVDTRLIDRRTGRRKFMDHKSVATFKVPMINQNQQILHYRLLEFLLLEDADQRCDTALYNMLRRVKRTAKAVPPFFMRLEISNNDHEIRAYRQHLVGTIAQMQRVEAVIRNTPELLPMVAPPTPHRDCDWKCEFQSVCRLFDDGSRVEAALEAKYETGNPLDYYQGREVREE